MSPSSSSAPSVFSRGPNLNLRNMTFLSNPNVEISIPGIQGPAGNFVRSFSTLDRIEGTVNILSKTDIRFDDLEISFNGVEKTFVDKLSSTTAMAGRSESTHRFLKLQQPIRNEDLPQPRILAAGRLYSFPFTFVVPSQLLPKSCGHKTTHENVKNAHLQLPPSFGVPELSGFGSSLLDDLSPDMSRVTYSIKAILVRNRDDGSDAVLVEATRKLRIKPVFEEQPPLDIDGISDEYCHRQEKSIRKGVFKGKLGRLVIEAGQPKSFRLPALPPGAELPPISTMAKVVLRFDPAEEHSPPPRLSSLSSKIKVTTFYASVPRRDFPDRASSLTDMSAGYISDMISLSSMCVASVEWKKHESWESPVTRRDSALSTASALTMNSNTLSAAVIPDPSASYHGKLFYTATILVPIFLPKTKHLVPTFHTCLISRVYGLHLSLSTHGSPFGPSLSVRVPVQISSEGSVGANERRRETEQREQAILDVDAAFEPRNVAPPNEQYMGQSQILPPSYSSFQQQMGGGALSRERGAQGVPVF
ncbi:arrestin [Tothia fuscella]|uniref:Arrestin n=1 Tax=Tothia fuscella TaxID=1048955 RepID=A0A9P4NM96_9PEZI|nr:arrestin [Tothia fuscella]